MNDWVGAWLLARVNPPHLLNGLDYVAKHNINGECKAVSLMGRIPRNWILTYIRLMFLHQLKFCIFCELRNSDRNLKIQMLEGCRLRSSAVFGTCQQIEILRNGTAMTR